MYKKSLSLMFAGKRNTLSTSALNGGYHENLLYIYNNDCKLGAGMGCKLKADTYEEHLAILAGELGFEAEKCSGMGTAASMENVSIKIERHGDLVVTAIVTGGIDTNGGRVGDPASWDEWANRHKKMSHGTINIILLIDAHLPAGTLTRALVTCTEAKTAAIQELMGGSNYSNDLATGSGTDGSIIVGNMESEMKLTNAGKHSKLGELIGLAVKAAVKEALYKQTGLSPESQHCVLARLKRYGISLDSLWDVYPINDEKTVLRSKLDFIHQIENRCKEDELLAPMSAIIHLLDQYRWELLKKEETQFAIHAILFQIVHHYKIEFPLDAAKTSEDLQEWVLEQISKLLIALIFDNKSTLDFSS